MKRHTRQLGISTSNVVGILACASIGAWVGGFLLTVVGVEVFQPQIRFLAFMFSFFLAPVWMLFQDLKKLKDHDGVTKRQAREIDHRVRKGLRLLARFFCFYVVGALLIASSGLWPSDPVIYQWFARIAGAVIVLSLGLVWNVLMLKKELQDFETRLARLKQDKEHQRQMLEDLRKDNGIGHHTA